MRLIIGPTSGGKSTYIKQMQEDAADAADQYQVHFAFSVMRGEDIPRGPHDIVYYNLLHGAPRRSLPLASIASNPGLVRLVEAADDVVVIAAPRSVLLGRAGGRDLAEPDHEEHADRRYDQDVWLDALQSPDLAQVYEHLCLMLDTCSTPYQMLCSNADVHGGVVPISRYEFPRLAADDAESWCQRGHAVVQDPGSVRSYQNDARLGPVSATLSRALQMPLAGKTFLDIGCAEGGVALSAVRMGATVTGIDPRPGRLAKARRAAAALDLDLELRQMTLDGVSERPWSFDVVCALNVAHHVANPFAFLERAAHLSASHLVLEYPGLHDEKFASTLDGAGGLSDEVPLVGVSTREQDQTFVFTPAALERFFLDTVGLFKAHRLVESPMPHRWISVFSRRRRPDVFPGPSRAELVGRLQKRDRQLRKRGRQLDKRTRQLSRREQRIAALERQLQEMETSRSWRVTAPLRKVTGGARPGS